MALTIERGTPTPAWRFWSGDKFRFNPNGPVLEVVSIARRVWAEGMPWYVEYVNPADAADPPVRRRLLREGADTLLIAEEVTR